MTTETEDRIARAIHAVETVYTESCTNWAYLYANAKREQDAWGINRGAGDEEPGTYEARQIWNDAHADLQEAIGQAMEVFGIEGGGCIDHGVYSIGNEDIWAENEHAGIRSLTDILGQCDYAIREALGDIESANAEED
ncbi:hypothetical protein [Arthrobacter sp. 162MFSha1.1]|uniref:hypothetical protein n=1 Tax=Arthrobacter sp. 162MFSha1.1 TaxID=1151119 RepID=UPI00038098FC|nr:hypothetical protein [Arthrobacter sp. 162MFSha1.1]